MKAVVFEKFGGPIELKTVSDPAPPEDGVVLRVTATGVCRSDWHGWIGHESYIDLPHVPGHEMAGIIETAGPDVRLWKQGDRVTLPFVCACGHCPRCTAGDQQVCDHQVQPGFSGWGSFAEYTAIHHADVNLVALPDAIDDVAAASLGCRFVTSFRAVADQGRVRPGQWVAVHGCGGVGLSAVMIAHAMGARVIGVDIGEDQLNLARSVGAQIVINAESETDVAGAIQEVTKGGAHVSLDALGSPVTCANSVACLAKRGKHIQVGLMAPAQSFTSVPMDIVISRELEILGSHGMQAHRYPELLGMIISGKIDPKKLVGKTISLAEAPDALTTMDAFKHTGMTVIDRF